MPTRISTDDSKLLNYYDELMQEFYNQHHVHSTNIANIPMTDSERAAMAEAQAMADQANGKGGHNKKVIFHSDPNYCNGLPRRKR